MAVGIQTEGLPLQMTEDPFVQTAFVFHSQRTVIRKYRYSETLLSISGGKDLVGEEEPERNDDDACNQENGAEKHGKFQKSRELHTYVRIGEPVECCLRIVQVGRQRSQVLWEVCLRCVERVVDGPSGIAVEAFYFIGGDPFRVQALGNASGPFRQKLADGLLIYLYYKLCAFLLLLNLSFLCISSSFIIFLNSSNP